MLTMEMPLGVGVVQETPKEAFDSIKSEIARSKSDEDWTVEDAMQVLVRLEALIDGGHLQLKGGEDRRCDQCGKKGGGHHPACIISG